MLYEDAVALVKKAKQGFTIEEYLEKKKFEICEKIYEHASRGMESVIIDAIEPELQKYFHDQGFKVKTTISGYDYETKISWGEKK